ncbi:concanavalin A-like lectin/glucanase [Aureobasidium subglaciale]|nr:concanavalin A-like lectin/glucanase [Aureobasidium subglaciale]
MKKAVTNILALASATYAYTPSAAGTKSGCYWNTDAGQFNTRFGHDFAADLYGTVDDLVPSTYTVNAGVNPLARRFDLVNIGLDAKEQALTLTVPGGQTNGPISSAQLATSFNDILYASIRTVAKISNVPGTTHGFIFYANDTQEVDFAWLTSDVSKAWLTNEQVSYGSPYSTYSVGAPADASSAYHEYRLDWLPGVSKFYIDGALVQTITDNSPSTPGAAIWNNWSNGNAWAQGPPLADSILRIRSIDAYFNRTSVADNISANPSSCPAVVVSSSSSSIAPSSTSVSSSSSSVMSSSSVSPSSSSSVLSSTSSSSVLSSSSSSSSSASVVSSSTKSSSSSVASTSSTSSVASTTSSSSSSSSVAPSSSSVVSTSSTSVVAPTSTAPATVSFTTITTAWTGLSTSTRTVVSGLVATVYVQTPAAKGQVISTSSSTKASYTTVTTHSGTASSIGYITTTPKLAGATTTVTIVYPTPVTSCGNQGINFAAYSNKYSGGQATYGYPSFIPETYKKVSPTFSDDTTYIAETNDQYGNWINLYGYNFVDGSNLVLDHTFYLFASQTGYYSLNIPYTDDIQFVWIGNNAVTGWNRANADIIQFWSSQIATQTPQTLAYYLTVGSYLPKSCGQTEAAKEI